MNNELLALSTLTRKDSGSGQLVVPEDVLDTFGDDERVAWFLDRDAGLVYLVPESEVTVR